MHAVLPVAAAPEVLVTPPPLDVCKPIADSDADERHSPVPKRVLHDAWACTLMDGCIKRVNHTGLCQIEASTPRASGLIDYSTLNSSGGRRAGSNSEAASQA